MLSFQFNYLSSTILRTIMNNWVVGGYAYAFLKNATQLHVKTSFFVCHNMLCNETLITSDKVKYTCHAYAFLKKRYTAIC